VATAEHQKSWYKARYDQLNDQVQHITKICADNTVINMGSNAAHMIAGWASKVRGQASDMMPSFSTAA
jgi:hypothetical protein